MAMLSTKIIGTPRGSGHSSIEAALRVPEFTPIGMKSRSKASSEDLSRNSITRGGHTRSKRALFNPIRENTGRLNHSELDSSFDNTEDNLDNTIGSFQLPSRPKNENHHGDSAFAVQEQSSNGQFKSSNSGFARGLEERNFITNDAPSIKEQESRSKKLETDNYNLKIKLATLQRYIDETPEEQRQLLNENISLKQQLFSAKEESDFLKKANQDLEYSSNKENSQGEAAQLLEQQNFQLRAEYKEIISQRNQEIQSLEAQLEKYRSDINSHQDAVNIMDSKLMSEVKQLREENTHLSDSLRKSKLDVEDLRTSLVHVEQRANETKGENRELNEALSSSRERATTNESEMKSLRNTIELLKDDLIIIENSKKAAEKALNSEISNLQVMLNDSKSELKVWKDKFDGVHNDMNGMNELSSKVNKYQRAYEELKARSMSNDLEVDKLSSEKQRLESRLDRTLRDLKEKEAEEFNLRSQISALVRDKNSRVGDDEYVTQIESLQRKENSLSSENRRLKSEVDSLRDQVYQSNMGTSNQAKKLREELIESKDRIEFYETEYESLEKKQETLESKISSMLREIEEKDKLIDDLNYNAKSIRHEASSLSFDHASKRKLELDKHTLERENRRLLNELESANYEIERFKQENDFERSKGNKITSLERSYQDLLADYRDLQTKLRDAESYRLKEDSVSERQLREIESKYFKEISSNQRRIQDLEMRVAEATRTDDSMINLMREKSTNESKIRKLETDLDRSTRMYETELSFLKNKIKALESQSAEKEQGESSIVLLLERQLERQIQDSKKAQDDLNSQLSEAKLRTMETDKDLLELKSKYEDLESLIKKMENSERVMKIENERLDIKNRGFQKEVDTLSKYNTALTEKIKQLRQRHYASQDNLTHRFSNLDLDSKKNQEITLLNNELKYFKAKLHDYNLKTNDLMLMYTLVISSVDNSSKLIKNDIQRLLGSGIYPEYANETPRDRHITFKVLAQYVLSAIRIKNRAQKANSRKMKLFELKNDIENDKLALV